jgi:hypothetical protein
MYSCRLLVCRRSQRLPARCFRFVTLPALPWGIACSIFALFAPSHNASAVLVDWDTVTWAPGSVSNSLDVDPGTPGNDVAITVGGVNVLTDDIHTSSPTPQIDMSLTGGLSPAENSFDIAGNLHTKSKVAFSLTFTPQYSLGAKDVTFTIFDIDLGTNRDEIDNIYGIALDGTHVAPTITNLGAQVTLTGIGLNQLLSGTLVTPDSGAGSSGGNATISFGNTPITGFAFTFGNNAGAPRYQQIALGDIFFTPIPEVNSALPAILLCTAAAALDWRRRRRRKFAA